MKKNELYISADVESSGPIPGEYSMLSIGACVVSNINKKFYLELKPLNNNYVFKAMQAGSLGLSFLNNLKNQPEYDPKSNLFKPRSVLEKLKEIGTNPDSAMHQFKGWIRNVSKGHDPVLVAFNAPYDWQFINYYFHKFLKENPLGISALDIKANFMGKFSTGWYETSKRDVKQKLNLHRTHTHNALEDAIEQAEIFERLLNMR